MDDQAFMEIANEIKGLHNGALERIRQRQFDAALELYRRCLQITDLLSYHEGSAMTLYSMANLATLAEDYPQAIVRAEQALEHFCRANLSGEACTALLTVLATAARKKGVQLERSRRFGEAIDHFEAAIPHADQANSSAMRHEAALLRRILDEGNGTDSRRPATT